jgi:hypothetical protein
LSKFSSNTNNDISNNYEAEEFSVENISFDEALDKNKYNVKMKKQLTKTSSMNPYNSE